MWIENGKHFSMNGYLENGKYKVKKTQRYLSFTCFSAYAGMNDKKTRV